MLTFLVHHALQNSLPYASYVTCKIEEALPLIGSPDSLQDQAASEKSDKAIRVIVSRLDEDPDGSYTEKVIASLSESLSDYDFIVTPICETLRIAPQSLGRATKVIKQRARDWFAQHAGDLLLWGKVAKENDNPLTLYIAGRHDMDLFGPGPDPHWYKVDTLPKNFNPALILQFVTESVSEATLRGAGAIDKLRPLADSLELHLKTQELTQDQPKLTQDQLLKLKIVYGRALTAIGGQGDEPQSLRKAVEVLEGALQESQLVPEGALQNIPVSDRKSCLRYTAQTELAYALIRLGERYFDREILQRAINLSEETVECYQDPDLQAEAQQNLGRALLLTGQLDADTAALDRAEVNLKEAAAAAATGEDAFEEGESLAFLGIALTHLGERSGDAAQLDRAIDTLEQAADKRDKKTLPLGWGTAQSALGVARAHRGNLLNDDVQLQEAAQTLRESLAITEQKSKIVHASRDQTRLGFVLILLGERHPELSHLKEAEQLLRTALMARTPAFSARRRAETQTYLARALIDIGAPSGDVAEADALLKDALPARQRQDVPLLWAETMAERGRALAALGAITSNQRLLQEAAEVLSDALQERTKDRVPVRWAETAIELAHIERMLGRWKGDALLLKAADDRMDEVSDLLKKIKAPSLASRLQPRGMM